MLLHLCLFTYLLVLFPQHDTKSKRFGWGGVFLFALATDIIIVSACTHVHMTATELFLNCMDYNKRRNQFAVVPVSFHGYFTFCFNFFVLSKISCTFIVLTELRCNKDLAHRVLVKGLTKCR